jgi:hypothetical protein
MYAFENIESEIAKVNSEMQSLQYEVSDCSVRVFSRLNPNVIPPVDHPINEIRGSLRYRINAIKYHLIILIDQRKGINEHIQKHFANGTANPGSIEHLILHHYYFFDDVIFNLLSMFDYLSAMIGYMFENKYYKWNSLVRSARNNTSIIGKETFLNKLVDLHTAWVDPLIEFRSDIIHRSPKFGDGSLNKGGYKKYIPNFTTIKVPDKLSKLLRKIDLTTNLGNKDLIDCSIKLTRYSFIASDELLKEIK